MPAGRGRSIKWINDEGRNDSFLHTSICVDGVRGGIGCLTPRTRATLRGMGSLEAVGGSGR
jgi:hypothetical protein